LRVLEGFEGLRGFEGFKRVGGGVRAVLRAAADDGEERQCAGGLSVRATDAGRRRRRRAPETRACARLICTTSCVLDSRASRCCRSFGSATDSAQTIATSVPMAIMTFVWYTLLPRRSVELRGGAGSGFRV